ncbi:MAG: hypothetical protein JWM89_2626 [Acidimicrobiales bacterium]|nr:hypothetical protein [Acidimicrobiales bacterium]
MSVRALALTVLLGCAAPLAGCSGHAGRAVDRQPVTDFASAIGLDDGQASITSVRGRHLAFESSVRACMARQGFTYVVEAYRDDTADVPADLPLSIDAARRAGYGISTRLTAGAPTAGPSAPTDPNDAQVASMGEAERTAFTRALGPADRTAGCRRRAADAEAARVAPVAHDLDVLARGFGQAVRHDAEIARLDRSWQSCMRDAGFRVDDDGEARDLVTRRLDAATRSDPGGEGPSYDPGRLASTQAFERSIAGADARCHVPLEDGYARALARVAQDLTDQYGAQIAKVKRQLGHR